ncbi:MAG: galactokinase [Pseudooceanicola sp.]|nr:galactokinase [Pseudooceanicola sp.]
MPGDHVNGAGPRGSVITRVTPIAIDKFLFVEVETRDGIVGTGEASSWAHLEATEAAIGKFGDYLVGRSACDIAHHWEVMRRFGSYSGSVIMAAISAIDIALWDIKGQRLGAPIVDLLGGRFRDRVRVYGQARGASRAELVAHCLALKAAGFTAIGHVNPFLDGVEPQEQNRSDCQRMDEAVATLFEVREALGQNVDLGVELHRRLRPAEAIQLCGRIGAVAPLFLEDPIRPDAPTAMASVQAATTIPIATGERFYASGHFLQLLTTNAVRYLRPSIGLCGGITGMGRVAALAAAFDVDIIPHNPTSPIATTAALHVALSVPNLLVAEFPTAHYTDDVATTDHIAGELVTATPVQQDGHVRLGDAPGLGTALRDGAIRRQPVRPIRVDMKLRADGSPMEH